MRKKIITFVALLFSVSAIYAGAFFIKTDFGYTFMQGKVRAWDYSGSGIKFRAHSIIFPSIEMEYKWDVGHSVYVELIHGFTLSAGRKKTPGGFIMYSRQDLNNYWEKKGYYTEKNKWIMLQFNLGGGYSFKFKNLPKTRLFLGAGLSFSGYYLNHRYNEKSDSGYKIEHRNSDSLHAYGLSIRAEFDYFFTSRFGMILTVSPSYLFWSSHTLTSSSEIIDNPMWNNSGLEGKERWIENVFECRATIGFVFRIPTSADARSEFN